MLTTRTTISALAVILALSGTTMAAAAQAAPVNPYTVLDQSRDELAGAHPELATRELDALIFRIADIRSMQVETTDVRGSWACQLDGGTAVLSIRAHSYFLERGGRQMGGEYVLAGQTIDIGSGPLRGMGIAQGTLDGAVVPRQISFKASHQEIACREVL